MKGHYRYFIMLALLIAASFLPMMDDKDRAEGSIAFENDQKMNADTVSASQWNPDVADKGNNVYVVWQDDRGGTWDIYFRPSTDTGVTFGSEVRVDDTGITPMMEDDKSEQRAPAMAVGPDGTIYVVWQDDRDGRPLIYMARSSDQGATFSANYVVSYNALGRQEDPEIAISDDGTMIVVWEDSRLTMGVSQIYAATSNDGKTFSGAVRVSDTAIEYNCLDPSVAFQGSNRVHVVWSDPRYDDEDVYVSSSSDGGSTFSPSLKVSKDPSGSDQTGARIAANGTHIFVSWADSRGASLDIYMAYSLDNGGTFSKDACVHPNKTSGQQYEPDMRIDRTGNLTYVWTSSPGFSDKRSDIQMTRRLENGTTESVYTVNGPVADATQDQPALSVSIGSRAYIAWRDDRSVTSEDIYFTRTTVSGQEGSAPKLTNGSVNPQVGGIGWKFTFTVMYSDVENDNPEEDFPMLCLYYRGAGGKIIDYPNSPFPMNLRMIPPPDFDYRNGETYIISIIPDRQLDLLYCFSAKAASGNLSEVRTEVSDLPLIDSTGPTFQRIAPSEEEWVNENIVTFNVDVSDDISGVDPWSVFYQKMNLVTGEWETWQRRGTSEVIDQDTVRVSVNITLLEGKENMVRFRAKDLVQNGANGQEYSVSPSYQVWVDAIGPTIDVTSPEPGDILYDPFVHIRARIADQGSGVNASSLLFSYSTDGINAFLPWVPVSDIGGSVSEDPDAPGEYLAQVNVSLTYGDYNYIRLKAYDALDNNGTTSNIQVVVQKKGSDIVDRPPSVVESVQPKVSGSVRPHITWSASYDPDGDLVTYYLRVQDLSSGEYVQEWTGIFYGTYWDPDMDMQFVPGHEYMIEIVPTAKGLNGTKTTSILQISTEANLPPEAVKDLVPRATSDRMPVLSWDPSTDPEGDEVFYFLRMGTYLSGGNIVNWTSVFTDTKFSVGRELGIGLYYVDIICSDGKDFSPLAQFPVSIGIYSPFLKAQRSTVVVYPGFENITLINITVSNKGFTFDNMRLRLDGPASERVDIDLTLGDNIIDLAAGSSTNTTLRVYAAEDAVPGIYALNITASSVDGISAYSIALSVRVVDLEHLDDDSGVSPDDDGSDNNMILWVLFAMLLIVLSAMFYGYYRMDKKQKEQNVELVSQEKASVPPPKETGSIKGETIDGKPKLPPKKGAGKKKSSKE